ncbi:PEGA domain-containing protein [Candidatus Dojkabacteria bacterium]|nr:PEGA domain-containing protein [Candidatus Dojkabacteria bacterium]
MKKRLQKLAQAFFILFVVAAFGCITVLTLIIAQGGKITRDGIKETGIIRINSEPGDGIKVYVDDEKVSLVDKRIEGLEAGEYVVRIEKEGYLPWEKKVLVDVGIVKEIYASLLKEDLELQQLTNTNIDRVFFAPEGNYAYYVITQSEVTEENGVWRLKLSQNTLESIGLVSTESEKLSDINKKIEKAISNSYSIDIAPDNSKFILKNGSENLFYVYNISEGELVDIKSPTSLGFIPDRYYWFKNGDSLIAQTGNNIYEINLSSNQITLVYNFQETDPVYAVNGRNVIIYANDSYYVYENETRNLLSPKFELPVPDQLWLSQTSDDLLYVKSGDLLYFSNLKKELVKVGQYDVLDVAHDGQNALLSSEDGSIYSFRGELIVAIDKINVSTKLIKKNYNPKSESYTFSPDNNYLLERILENGTAKFRLIGLYGENNYDLLETTRHVGMNNFGLVNGSSEFLILLKDIVPNIQTTTGEVSEDNAEAETETQPATPDANLYKIELVD